MSEIKEDLKTHLEVQKQILRVVLPNTVTKFGIVKEIGGTPSKYKSWILIDDKKVEFEVKDNKVKIKDECNAEQWTIRSIDNVEWYIRMEIMGG